MLKFISQQKKQELAHKKQWPFLKYARIGQKAERPICVSGREYREQNDWGEDSTWAVYKLIQFII